MSDIHEAAPAEQPNYTIGLADLIAELKQIKELLGEQSSAAFRRGAAARFLGVSPATLDRLTSAGKLRSVRVSEGRVVWRRADLQAYLDQL
ncbi:MAG TPA: helix-turn-helix domain-containing protein [Gemmataceae bacterium]|nr:helix-turn-helix domain-containing protein [Gemmataceae bacterium]